jgi:dipeptidyl aminopeptidase/acylaminoacyl peptidase
MLRRPVSLAIICVALTLAASSHGDEPASGYRQPPEAIRKVLDIPPQPATMLSPDRQHLVLVNWQRYPSIADLARPTLRLAGYRIDPATNGPERGPRYTALTIRPLKGGEGVKLALPPDGRPDLPDWAPDGKQFALANTTASGIDLWLGTPTSPKLRKVEGLRLNAAGCDPVTWFPDGETLLCWAVPVDRSKPPAQPEAPPGPVIQVSTGKKAPARTYQDLLKNKHDEALFDYYFTSQLVLVDTESGKVTPVGKPGIIDSCQPAPDGKHLLVVWNHRPFSYTLPANDFPHAIEVWDTAGKLVHRLADLPLADGVPIEGVPTGPRNVAWRPDQPATLVYVEALDGGDPAKKAPHRDCVLSLAAPFKEKPAEIARTEHRAMGLTWSEKGLALLSDYDRDTRHRRTFLVDGNDPEKKPRLLWDRSIQDRYNDPGTPLLTQRRGGRGVLRTDGDDLFLAGLGASPKGERPFLDRYNLKTGKTVRLFQSKAGSYETVVDVLSDDGSRFLTRHESPDSPPNLRIREAEKDTFTAVTEFRDRAPELRKITRQLVQYKRADGVPLSFTLYLPPDYKEGTRLPAVVWAYPREFTDPSVAGQVVGSPDRYTTLVGTSHLFFLLAGYAVLDGATMPVVGSAEKANDTFVEQIVSSAKAAIDKANEMGVIDPDRVGVGGHSYGAFMTANLLAHSDLFRAGIARSGAYNRTLTPFGFQSERRTFWQAPKVYLDVSPFMHAQKINEPILLIHGAADNNPGTFPMQSERLFQAIRGNGGTARLVMLPHESHVYAARDSVEHVLWEMTDWFERYVKTAPPR